MLRTIPRLVVGVLSLGAALACGEARAQAPGAGSSTFANPYMNPYMNPYINPLATVNAGNRNDALLYLWSAQQMPGGLMGGPAPRAGAGGAPGSPRAGSPGPAAGRTAVAEMPRSAMQPGGGASRYFNKGSLAGPSSGVPGSRYQQHARYFSNNGR